MISLKDSTVYFDTDEGNGLLLDIYRDEQILDSQRERLKDAINEFSRLFGADAIEIYSAPGRTEIGGNHTDHQHGEVLAGAINRDAVAIVSPRDDGKIRIISKGYNKAIEVDAAPKPKDPRLAGTSTALVNGVIAHLSECGFNTGGFNAYVTSNVLSGSGLSSSAAFETLIGSIISGLYNNMRIHPTQIAITGQYAENEYFGKPCGLMDQMASSTGGLVHIDFRNPADPVVEKIEAEFEKSGYCLCITDTKGSHADLTPDYAAIPAEMKSVAALHGKEVLIDVSFDDILANINLIREKAGDRALLRAIHFFEENKRAHIEAEAVKAGNFESFLRIFKESARSSFEYLQNVYPPSDISRQNTSVALALSELILRENGAARIHGGGFEGTIQAFVKIDKAAEYKKHIDAVFGPDSCSILYIRKFGGMKIL